MKVNGIVAEYNPFHNGHAYQLEESRRLTGADYTVVVMSGNFVQRGAPAMAEKRTRAEIALRCGADLALELPILYAASSSEYFAAGAVALLDRLGVVTHLCFGSECGDIGQLRQVAALLAKEPEEYRLALRDFLKKGLSYPDARAKALSGQAPFFAGCGELLAAPNNILGIDYLKTLFRRKSPILPVTVKRMGAGYHETLSQAADIHMLSASAIRQALLEGQPLDRLRPSMPQAAGQLLDAYLAAHRPLVSDAFSDALYYKLLLEQEQGYERYLDISPDLSNRIQNRLNGFTGFGAFCDLLKTKALTHTRISRGLLHILLDIRKEDMLLGKSLDDAPYARVLGFRKSAIPLLGAIKAHASVPLITRPAAAQKNLPAAAGRLLRQDILASEVYKGTARTGTGQPARHEYATPPVIV